MRALLAAFVCIVLLAGCFGKGNDSTSASGTGGSTGIGTGISTRTGNGTGPAPGGTWHSETTSGDFEAVPGVATGASGAIQFFTVPDNATSIWLNITITAAVPTGSPATEFEVDYHDPDHQSPSDPAQGVTMTANGKSSIQIDAPTTGDWTVSIFSSAAPNQGHFDLVVSAYW